MRIDSKFKLRSIAGENIIVNQGKVGSDLTKIISLNSSACILYKHLIDKEFTLADAAHVLEEVYHVDSSLAEKDAASWVEALKKCHVIVD